MFTHNQREIRFGRSCKLGHFFFTSAVDTIINHGYSSHYNQHCTTFSPHMIRCLQLMFTAHLTQLTNATRSTFFCNGGFWEFSDADIVALRLKSYDLHYHAAITPLISVANARTLPT